MLTILYVLVACILTSVAMEQLNKQLTGNNRVVNIIKGWPAYATTVVACVVFALIVCVMPGGPGFSLTMWALLTFAIYFGNQFVFQTFIKTIAKYRKE